MTAFVQTQVVEVLIQGIFEVNSDLKRYDRFCTNTSCRVANSRNI